MSKIKIVNPDQQEKLIYDKLEIMHFSMDFVRSQNGIMAGNDYITRLEVEAYPTAFDSKGNRFYQKEKAVKFVIDNMEAEIQKLYVNNDLPSVGAATSHMDNFRDMVTFLISLYTDKNVILV